MGVFDGMADIFIATFGEGEQQVIYTPLAGGDPVTVNAIWWESTQGLQPMADGVFEDVARTELHLRASDVPDPQEGDTATRVRDGKVMTITTPIRADGKGMIMCNLAAQEG